MNKYKEALDDIKSRQYQDDWDNLCDVFDEDDEAIATLQELVDKEQPKKVVHIHVLKQFGVCPMCNFNVNIRNHNVACGNCGQALDWSKE